jgi:hypothetical protein
MALEKWCNSVEVENEWDTSSSQSVAPAAMTKKTLGQQLMERMRTKLVARKKAVSDARPSDGESEEQREADVPVEASQEADVPAEASQDIERLLDDEEDKGMKKRITKFLDDKDGKDMKKRLKKYTTLMKRLRVWGLKPLRTASDGSCVFSGACLVVCRSPALYCPAVVGKCKDPYAPACGFSEMWFSRKSRWNKFEC